MPEREFPAHFSARLEATPSPPPHTASSGAREALSGRIQFCKLHLSGTRARQHVYVSKEVNRKITVD